MVQEEYFIPIKANRGWSGLPEESKNLYKSRYFMPDEDYELWLDRVCRTFSDDREHRGRMKQYIRNYWFHPATPVSANAGLPESGFPVSCFVQSVDDSKDGIIDAWREGFYLAAKGAGIGRYWGNVRGSGEKVGVKGNSSGVIPFMKVDEVLTLAISQGNMRRGSAADYIHISHPDIEEFIAIRDPSGDAYRSMPELFNGVVIDDKFIEAVEKREMYDLISPKTGEVIRQVDAYELWTAILKQRMLRGTPYILYIDNVNDNRPEEYVKEGLEVETSQLCVAPETKILTKNGYVTIKDVAETEQEVWNGEEWSKVDVVKTNDNAHLLKIKTTGGDIECTDYHKFYIVNDKNETIEKRAWELNVGDRLIKFDLPVIEGEKEFDTAYSSGFLGSCDPDYFVPDASYTISSRLAWLAGVIDSNGKLIIKNDKQSYYIFFMDEDFPQEILLMLQTLGVVAKRNKRELIIDEVGIQKLLILGLKVYRSNPKIKKLNNIESEFIKVTAIIDENRYDETYCFTEPKRHMGMFNGLNIGQCSEITLHTASDYSAICVLSSINLEYYDEFKEYKEQFYKDVHRFLDNVSQNFIDTAKDEKGFDKVVKSGEYERSIGIGVMGLHYLFQKKGIPFDSIAAKSLNQQIFKEMRAILDKSNEELAEEKGASPLAQKHNIKKRNTHMLAIAPTASISTLCNKTSPSIEPLVTNAFAHKTNVQTTIVKNRILKELLVSKGKDNEDVWTQILADGGSVKSLDFLTDDEKEVFKTAFEIRQEAIIEMAADRQKYIDQSQSLNLFIKPGVDIEYLYDIHMFAWAKGVKSLYYVRSDAPKKVGVLSDMKSAQDAVLNAVADEHQTFNECIYCG